MSTFVGSLTNEATAAEGFGAWIQGSEEGLLLVAKTSHCVRPGEASHGETKECAGLHIAPGPSILRLLPPACMLLTQVRTPAMSPQL